MNVRSRLVPLLAAAALSAANVAGLGIERAAIDTAGFRFAKLTDVYDVDFMPGAVKYGDLPSLLALAAPTKLWLAGEGKSTPRIISAAFGASGKPEHLTIFKGESNAAPKQAITWLLK